jgi:hypothetical protein
MLVAIYPAMAEWSVTASGHLFYTDDVVLFSATRRSNLDADPTQPVLDTSPTRPGSDMVFEPGLLVSKLTTSPLGRTVFSVKAQGFVYTVNPEFSQGSVALEALHTFTPNTGVRLRYFTAPDQFLGEFEEHRTGTDSLQNVRVTSHIGFIRVEQRLSENWEVQLLGRIGVRRYNESFAQRDTTFWTIGPHVIWRLTDHAKLMLGYHYERGLADGRNQVQFEDDVSYVNNFVSLSLDAEIMEHLELELDAHYEHHDFTSTLPGDEHNGAHVNAVLGGARLLYRLTEHTGLVLGFQRIQLTQNRELTHNHNTNVSAGIIYRF